MSEQANPTPPAAQPPQPSPAPTQPAAPMAPVAAPQFQPQPERRSLNRIFLINGLALLVLVIVAGVVFYIWHQGYYFYSTDDAAVQSQMATIAPPAAGTISSVYHRQGDAIRKGDALLSLQTAGGASQVLRSPLNGTIVQEGAVAGEVVSPGQQLATVVDPSTASIVAYVEETHIKDVHDGQGVDVTVDTVSDTTFHGTVTQILPVAASALSALPTTDYASGNFTKVTQRIPVVITLDGYQGHQLFPGTSASVTIHIHS